MRGGSRHQHAHAGHLACSPDRLLSECRERRRCGRAADERDELASLHVCTHSITSSARATRAGDNSRPSALAVFKLITSSYLVGAARRKLSLRSTPWDSKPPTSAKKRNG